MILNTLGGMAKYRALLLMALLNSACRSVPADTRFGGVEFVVIGMPRRPTTSPSETKTAATSDLQLTDGEVVGSDVELLTCPTHFSSSLRQRWLTIGRQFYFIDDVGRPAGARSFMPPTQSNANRDAHCQREVGHLGDVVDPSADYDGGHLIARQLGGWPGRANLVPQNASFNRGNWAQLETELAGCNRLAPDQLKMEVSVQYADSRTLIPSVLTMTLTDSLSGTGIQLSFDNAERGGYAGDSERARGADWLKAIGCQ